MRNFPNHGRMLTAVILVLLKISVLSVCGQDRTEYQSKWVENKLNLHDHVEELSSISTIQNMGFTGQGTAIAVISTGIDKDHEQFGKRVIAENCFNSGKKCVPTDECDICREDDKECFILCYACEEHFVCENNGNSSNPVNAEKKDSFNRGSHLAGIAAGADGIAPGANIISVNIQSEYSNDPELFTEENPEGYAVTMRKEDLKEALEWLLDLQKQLKNEGKTPISVVVIDFSSDEYDFQCDREEGCEEYFDIFEEMIDEGMIPAAGTGDHYIDHNISFPACLSNVIAVGALPDMSKPMIAAYSDHNDMVDILAPGTNIYSSILADNDEDGNYTCPENCYGEMTGTSEAASVTGGALALLAEAFPGKTMDEYRSMLREMSTRTVDWRNSNTHDNLTNDDGNGTPFDFNKPILDFSNFKSYYINFPYGAAGSKPSNRMEFFFLTSDHLPKTGFSALHPQELRSKPLNVRYTPTNLAIRIPQLSIESDLLLVPEISGEYPVEWLGDSIGMLEGSALPGKGVMVLTAHNHLNTTENGPFVALGTLNMGDHIFLTDANNRLYPYQISGNYKIDADGFASIAGDLGENTLVMITCEDEAASGGYLHRRVIFADPL